MTSDPMLHATHLSSGVSDGGPSDFVERTARIGYTAKGIVYLVIGGLAAAAAFGAGGKTTGSEGALETILHQPFGRVMLGIVALGLIGYAVWRFVQLTADPENKGTDLEGLTLRGYYLVSAIIHSALVVTAVRMILTGGSSGSGGGTEEQAATLMSQPYGRWLLGLAGLAVIGSAFYQWYRAWVAEFRDRVTYREVNAEMERWLVRFGRIGLAARGVVFAIIGGFLVIAAVNANPDQAKGWGETLATLEAQPYGPWVLATIAIGVLLYGAHQLAKARWREIG